MRGVKDKRRVLETVHEGVCPSLSPLPYSQCEIAFSKYTTKIYPWEWESPTILDMDTNQDHLCQTWDSIISYMQKKYDSFDSDMLEETATSGISINKDCAVFFFSQNK
ncbi:MAG: hypothetical protein PHO15_09620 [Eubacteriales bacterium]|nr:hypothetical protein [Eubacteriales bacterium]